MKRCLKNIGQKGNRMRLIDVNRLLENFEDHDMVDSHIIYNSPTVEAIPIEFIELQKNILRSLLEYSAYEEGSNKETFALSKKVEALEELLKDWKEHEFNN